MKYQAIVESTLDVVTKMGDEYLCRCPMPAHKGNDAHPSLQVNIRKGLYVCFACGWKGLIGQKKTSRCGVTVKDYFDGFQLPPPSLTEISKRLAEISAMPAMPDLPDYAKESSLIRYSMDTSYWENRGLKSETISAFDLGYDFLENAGTIPLRTYDGHLLGVAKRYIDHAYKRYIYPNSDHFKKSRHLHGSWLFEKEQTHTAVLVEGPVDTANVWQAGYAALGIYGSRISPSQIRLLHRLDVRRVILMFDRDDAGTKCTQQVREDLKSIQIMQAFYPEDYLRGKKADPGGMPNDLLSKCLAHAR